MQNENITKFIEQLKNNWQLLAFGIFLLGYITFAFYIQMNGFSFILPDLKFLVAFGLIVFLLCLPNIIFSQTEQYSWQIVYMTWGLTPILFVTSPAQAIPSILFAIGITGLLLDYIKTGKGTAQEQNREKKVDKFLLILLVLLIFIMDWQFIALLVLNIFFFLTMQSYYKKENRHNPLFVVAYIFITAYLVASLVNSRGLTIANMCKSNIKCSLENDTIIEGILVFQDSNTYYITTKNKHLSVDKSLIKSPIQFTTVTFQNSNSLLMFIKNLFKSDTKSN